MKLTTLIECPICHLGMKASKPHKHEKENEK